jgi:hypothetical protein
MSDTSATEYVRLLRRVNGLMQRLASELQAAVDENGRGWAHISNASANAGPGHVRDLCEQGMIKHAASNEQFERIHKILYEALDEAGQSTYQAPQPRAETAEARLLALQVDRSKAVKLRDDTDNVIWALKPDDVPGAINWGDLGVREVQEVIDEERRWYRVVIEEADPSNPELHAAVTAGLVVLGWNADDIEIETAW